MRASVFVGTSLDGFIARADDTLDFLSHGGDEPHGFEEFLSEVDALLMGRRTYDVDELKQRREMIPLDRDVVLRHVETRTYPGGLVQSEYVTV